MSAKSAAATYAELDKMATDRLLSKARKAARRTNWRKYAVWAKGYRKKFFSCFSKAREYWNQIKNLGSVPSIQSWRFKSAQTTCTTVAVPLPVRRQFPIAVSKHREPVNVPRFRWSPAFIFRSPFAPPALATAAAVLAFFIA